VPQWLQEGDQVELEVTGLGLLSNYIERDDDDFSILALKKS
jgi:fumarylacetoacetate (FAA) hydrolase